MAENPWITVPAINHSDIPIVMDHDDRQPPIATPAVPGHFLDGAEDLQTVFERIRERVIDKYELGEIVNLDSRGFAEAEQHRTQLPPTPTLQELAKHVFTSLKDKQDKLWSNIASHNFIITDLEAVNKLLGQLEGGGAVPGPRAYISVLGRYNVGKSTLLNALLSFDVLPTSEDAETAVTVFVQHRKIEVPELCKMSDGEVLKRGAENIKSYLEEVQQKVRDDVLSATSSEYLVRVPIPCFTRKRDSSTMVTPLLVDTPGSNEVSQDKLKKLAYLNLQTATAYIYVMSFTELRNQHDYTAFGHIQERDQAVFNEGRVAIAVTKMDESYKAGKKDAKKLTEFKVKEIVSSGIQQALKLNRVSPEIVYPLSGDFAFQARVAARDGESTEMVDVMKISWGNLMSASRGIQAFVMAESMSAKKLYGDLEESSHIGSLEKKIGHMIDQLDFIWQKSMATNCFLYINQALESLNDALERIGHQLADSKATVDQCIDIKRLYDAITESLKERVEDHADFVKQLEDSYAADTDTEKMMRKFRVHLDSFMKNVCTKIEAGNYTPKQLEADLDGIREEANEKLTQLCWQTTFDRCQQTLVSFLVIMTDKFGRMRSTLAKVCRQASSTGSLPQKPVPVPDSIEDKVRDAAPTLDQIPKQQIEVSARRWIGYAACKLLFDLPHIQLIKKEALGPIEKDIKNIVEDRHKAFFKERKDFVVLHFFKRYCKEMTDLMDVLFDQYQNCPIGLTDIATRAHSELKEKETLKDTCLHWKFELMQWRSRMKVSYGPLLPEKEDD